MDQQYDLLQEIKVAPPDAFPQERVTGDILRGHGPRRGNLEDLIRYWRPIMRKPGGFRRCVIILADHPKFAPPQRICAWLHHETTGKWPNEGNHHGRKKRGVSARGAVRRVGRRARKKTAEDLIGLDIPENGVRRRVMRNNGSILYEPISGRTHIIDFKIDRFVEGALSTVLPGEAHPLRVSPTRQIAWSLVFPGGIGPGIGKPRGGGGMPRNRFHCPAGFQHGGRFSNQFLSNCGTQLFTTPGGQGNPGQVRQALAARAQAIRDETSAGSIGRSIGSPGTSLRSRSINAPRSTNIVGVAPKAVGRPNPGRRDSVASSVVRKMNKSDKSNVSRFVRRDGSVIEPSAPLALIAKQRKNDDLIESTYVVKVSDPGPKLGVAETSLFGTGVTEVRFAVPGGVDVRLKAKKKLSPADAGRVQRAASSASVYEYDVAGALHRAASSTGLVELEVNAPRVSGATELVEVRTPSGATRTVQKWVYETYLKAGAPQKLKGAKAHSLVGRKKSINERYAEARFNIIDTKSRAFMGVPVGVVEKSPRKEWGPLEYTASPIPSTRDEAYWETVAYKAASFVDSQDEASQILETKARSVWDPDVARYRCPPGVEFGGRITNRIGAGCGRGVARAALGALGRAAKKPAKVRQRVRRAKKPVAKPRAARVADRVDVPTRPGEVARGLDRNGARRLGRFGRSLGRVGDGVDGNFHGRDPFGRDGRDLTPEQRERFGRIGRAMQNLAGEVDVPTRRGERERGLNRGGTPARPKRPRSSPSVRAADARRKKRNERERRQAGKRGRRVRAMNRFESDPVTAGMLNNPDRRKRDNVPALDNLNQRQKQRLLDRVSDEYASLEAQWARLLGKDDFTFRDINKYIRKREKEIGTPKGRAQIIERNNLRAMRDDWAELHPTFGFGVGDDEADLFEGIRRLSPNRRKRVMKDADFDQTERRIGQIDKDHIELQMRDFAVHNDRMNRMKEMEDRHRDSPKDHLADDMSSLRAVIRGFDERDRKRKKREAELKADVARYEREDDPVRLQHAKRELNIQGIRWRIDVLENNEAERVLKNLELWKRDADAKKARQARRAARTPQAPAKKPTSAAEVPGSDFESPVGNAASPVGGLYPIENAPKQARRGLAQRVGGNDARLGRFDEHGFAAIHVVPAGNAGIDNQVKADKHVAEGGDLADVPDEFLVDAIQSNMKVAGKSDGRFQYIQLGDGVNGMKLIKDTTTGKKLGIKFDSGDMYGVNEDAGELMGAHIAERFGFIGGALRVGGRYRGTGKTRQAAVVVELADNYVGPYVSPMGREMKIYVPDAVRMTFLDWVIQNTDRHHKNYFLKRDGEGYHFVPIDHGLAFGGRHGTPWYRKGGKDANGGDATGFKAWAGGDRGGYLNPVMYFLQRREKDKVIDRAEVVREIEEMQRVLREADERVQLGEQIPKINRALKKTANPFIDQDGLDGDPAVLARYQWLIDTPAEQLAKLLME